MSQYTGDVFFFFFVNIKIAFQFTGSVLTTMQEECMIFQYAGKNIDYF